MNYYMPYFSYNPALTQTITSNASRGLLSKLFGKGFNFGNILTTVQKTLGLVNQAIPVIKQVTPVMQNAKTMFKVMNEFKKIDTPNLNNTTNTDNNNLSNISESNINNTTNNIENATYNKGPTFFIN